MFMVLIYLLYCVELINKFDTIRREESSATWTADTVRTDHEDHLATNSYMSL